MKTNFKKLIALLLALAMLLTAFSGCNGKKSGSKKNSSEKKANTAVTSDLSSGGNTSSDLNDEDWEDPEDAGAEDDFDDPEEEEAIFSNIMLHNKTAVQQNFLGFNAVYHAYAYRKDHTAVLLPKKWRPRKLPVRLVRVFTLSVLITIWIWLGTAKPKDLILKVKKCRAFTAFALK